MCVGSSVGKEWEGGVNFALKEGRGYGTVVKQMHNEMLWIDCVSPEKDIWES